MCTQTKCDDVDNNNEAAACIIIMNDGTMPINKRRNSGANVVVVVVVLVCGAPYLAFWSPATTEIVFKHITFANSADVGLFSSNPIISMLLPTATHLLLLLLLLLHTTLDFILCKATSVVPVSRPCSINYIIIVIIDHSTM